MFMILDFYFQSQTYIIVYVGAIAIQFQFVIMLITLQTASGGEIIPYNKNMNFKYKKENIEIEKNIISAKINFYNKQLNKYHLYGFNIKYLIFSYFYYKKNINILKNINIFNKENKQQYSFFIPYFNEVNKKNNQELYINLSIFLLSFFIIILPIFLTIYYMPIGSYVSDNNITMSLNILDSEINIYNYIYPSWFIEYKTITDIENQAIIIYVAYPTALILISLTLWTVMIGIISICSPRI